MESNVQPAAAPDAFSQDESSHRAHTLWRTISKEHMVIGHVWKIFGLWNLSIQFIELAKSLI